MNWILTPYQSFGLIEFSESQASVIHKIGEPNITIKNPGKVKQRFLDDSVLVTFVSKKVSEISLVPSDQNVAYVQDINIFGGNGKEIVRKLSEIESGEVFIAFGILVFPNLGMTLSGIHDGDRSQAAISGFSRERYAALNITLKPFKL
jgi:hypothetical protein